MVDVLESPPQTIPEENPRIIEASTQLPDPITQNHREGILRRLIKKNKDKPSEESTDSKGVERAKHLKELWEKQDVSILEQLGAKDLRKGLVLLEERLLSEGVYFVGRSQEKSKRILRTSEELRADVTELIARVADFPMFLPDGLTVEKLHSVVDSYLKLLTGKKVYLREGLEGIVDLMNDGYLSSIVRRERVAQHSELEFDSFLSTLPESVQEQVKRLVDEGKLDKLYAYKPFYEYQKKIDKAEQEELVDITKTIATLNYSAESIVVSDIDLDRPESLPLEIQYILEKDPRTHLLLQSLVKKGLDIKFQRREHSPPKILEAISKIAIISQENFLISWLPVLLKEGRRPRLTPTQTGLKKARDMGVIEQSEMVDQQGLEKMCDLVQEGLTDFMSIEVRGVDTLDSAAEAALKELNISLSDIRTEYAMRRMLFDNAHERTEGARKIIGKMMYIGPVAHGLELAHLGTIAKLFTASTDDVMGEWAEMKALLDSGFSRRELAKRLPLLTGAFGLATFGAIQSEKLLESGAGLLAGPTFGASAVALSLTTSIQSVKMFHQAARSLAEQGKLPHSSQLPESLVKVIHSHQFKKSYKQIEKEAFAVEGKHIEEVYRLIKEELVRSGVREQEATSIISQAKEIGEELEKAVQENPSKFELWKLALRQDFSNPARLGILLGALSAPLAGTVASALGLLHNGLVLAGIGSAESLMAGTYVRLARARSDKNYRLYLEEQIRDQKAMKYATALPESLTA